MVNIQQRSLDVFVQISITLANVFDDLSAYFWLKAVHSHDLN